MFLVAVSNGLYLVSDHGDKVNLFWTLQATLWMQLGMVFLLARCPSRFFTWGSVASAYVFSRVLLSNSVPIFEDDYYRYLWDAQVLDSGINPYRFAPLDPFLDFLKTPWRESVNFPEVRTIYPPIAQGYFWVVYKCFGQNLWGLRIGATVLELSTAGALAHLVSKEERLKTAAVFLLFPTLMKENFNSVHFDLLAVIPILLALKTGFYRGLWLGLGICIKIFPLVLVPLFLSKDPKPFRLLSFIVLFCIGAYLPFVDSYQYLFSGTAAFAQDWLFFESFAALPVPKIRVILSIVLVAGIFTISRRKNALPVQVLVALFFILATSSVVNSWYWLWSLPLLILYGPKWTWALPVLTSLGYSWFADQGLYELLHQPIYGLLLLLAIYQILKLRDRNLSALAKGELSEISPSSQ